MTRTFFVTGTDTDVGKTVCCDALLQAANESGITTLAYKPIAAGCAVTTDGLRNEDALILQKSCNFDVEYNLINPIAFEEPIAPHIAAEIIQQPIDVNKVTTGLKLLQQKQPELLIVEGAGGWFLPLNDDMLLSEWVVEQQLPVILVVGMKLGCLNHALLTYEAIKRSGLKVAGWIANQVQAKMPFYDQNLTLLKNKIDAPLIAEIPHFHNKSTPSLAQYVNLECL